MRTALYLCVLTVHQQPDLWADRPRHYAAARISLSRAHSPMTVLVTYRMGMARYQSRPLLQ